MVETIVEKVTKPARAGQNTRKTSVNEEVQINAASVKKNNSLLGLLKFMEACLCLFESKENDTLYVIIMKINVIIM